MGRVTPPPRLLQEHKHLPAVIVSLSLPVWTSPGLLSALSAQCSKDSFSLAIRRHAQFVFRGFCSPVVLLWEFWLMFEICHMQSWWVSVTPSVVSRLADSSVRLLLALGVWAGEVKTLLMQSERIKAYSGILSCEVDQQNVSPYFSSSSFSSSSFVFLLKMPGLKLTAAQQQKLIFEVVTLDPEWCRCSVYNHFLVNKLEHTPHELMY